MLMNKMSALGLLLMSACASASAEFNTQTIPKTPIKGGVVEFTRISFDGEYLKGRVLVGATMDAFRVDGRLVEWIDIEVRNIRKCANGEALGHYLFDVLNQPPRPDEIVTVRPHFWYGADVDFRLFNQRRAGQVPDCFEADLMVWAIDGRIIATQPIHVERTDTVARPRAD